MSSIGACSWARTTLDPPVLPAGIEPNAVFVAAPKIRKICPVTIFVEEAGQLDTVILSAEHYQALQVHHDKASRAARKKRSEGEFGDWIAAQNASFEVHGIPGADLLPW